MAGEGSPRLLRLLPTFLFLLAATSFHLSYSSDTDVLLQFKETLSGANKALPDWVSGSPPCLGGEQANWTGVICEGGNVFGLQLEDMGLSGSLDLEPLTPLLGLRTLSFMGNEFVGLMPSIGKLGALKSIYLSKNKFSGVIPDDAFATNKLLKKVHLSDNDFSGPIPSSLAELPKLLELRLDGNEFTGAVPELQQPELKLVNVSDNDLEGPIPEALRRMDKSMFAGNKDLCGAPLAAVCDLLPSPTQTPPTPTTLSPPPSDSNSKKLSTGVIAAIIVIPILLILAIIAFFCTKCRDQVVEERLLGQAPSTKRPYKVDDADKLEQGLSERSSSITMKAPKEVEHGKLVFVRDSADKFQLQDLLKASAEVLGSGNFGSSYKAVLATGPAVVVKRFREMNGIGREDFQEHMRRLGRLSHPNLLPLLAYYYRREEKLLVTEYFPNGSLAHLLHGTSGANTPSLDWTTRLKIVKGVARGLDYLYEELPMLAIPHGHLKSSNVLLNDSYEALLTDYALVPVMNKNHASQIMVAYKSPEFTEYNRISKKSDIWCFGILILEVLTGKFPANYLRPGTAGADLASWVNSVVREEWTGEVFDSEMKGTKNCEGDMLKLLQIGLGCCERDEEKRWNLKQALDKIEQLKEKEGDDDDSSYVSYVSEGEMSSRGMTEDDFSFSRNY